MAKLGQREYGGRDWRKERARVTSRAEAKSEAGGTSAFLNKVKHRHGGRWLVVRRYFDGLMPDYLSDWVDVVSEEKFLRQDHDLWKFDALSDPLDYESAKKRKREVARQRRKATDGATRLAGRLHPRQHGDCARGRAHLRGGDKPFIHGAVSHLAETAVFISTWAAVTARSGMRDVTKQAKRFRLRGTAIQKKLDVLTRVRGDSER